MANFEDKLRNIAGLSEKYKDGIPNIKNKLKKLEKSFTQDLPFEAEILLGRPPIGSSEYVEFDVYLVKDTKNKIYLKESNHRYTYKNAPPDLLVLNTDQKLDEFLDVIQVEIKNRLPK